MSLGQKQNLNLIMTGELRQAIHLLQYSTTELYEYIEQQQFENPFIELIEKEGTKPSSQKDRRAKSIDENPIEFIADEDTCPSEMLLQQIRYLNFTRQEQTLVEYLIYSLDENGYIPDTNTEIASHLNIEEVKVENGIRSLQQLEPIGVGARNLRECLQLQASYYYPQDQKLHLIIMDHLTDLANKKWHDIAKALKIPLSDVRKAFELILTLNPKPCSLLSSEDPEYVTPDIVAKQSGRKLDVYLHDRYLPEIRFNQDYLEMYKQKGDSYQFVHKKYKEYKWLKSSIEKRRKTLQLISRTVMEKQKEFLEVGFAGLKPLTLKEVADEIEMHESTVSRATMNKTIQTPHGSYPLRKFFTSKLQTEDGGSTSAAKVKILIKDLIQQENKGRPISDQKLANHFHTEKGISISRRTSRRTIAKYREELNIPSSAKRKEFKL